MAVRLGLVGGGWISRHPSRGPRAAGADQARRCRLADGRDRGRGHVPLGRHALRRPRHDARQGQARGRLRGRAAIPGGGDRRAAGRGRDPVPDREAARGQRCGWAGPAGGRDREIRTHRRRRLPPPRARHPDRGPGMARRFAARSSSSPAGSTATPGPAWWSRAEQGGGQVIEQATHLYDLARLPGGRGDGGRGGVDDGRPDLAARLERGRQHRGGPPLRERRRSGRSPTRAGWRRRRSRSSSCRKGSSRP